MKILVRNNLCLYAFENSVAVDIGSQSVAVGNPLTLTISDCDSSNTTLYENITLPVDYADSKHMFDGTTWSVNSNWVAPKTHEEEIAGLE